MEPAVRRPWIEPAIIADRTRSGAFGLPSLPIFPGYGQYWPSNPWRGERNFWIRRQGAKIGLRDRKYRRRPNERTDTGENRRRNGLSGAGVGIRGFVGLDGGVRSRMRTRLSGDSTLETAAIRCFPLSLVKTGNSNPKDFGFRACYP